MMVAVFAPAHATVTVGWLRSKTLLLLTDGSHSANHSLTRLSARWICRGRRDQVLDDGFGTALITAIHVTSAERTRLSPT